VGSNPDTVYWMDVSVASYYIERKIIKVAKWGTPKKIFEKKESGKTGNAGIIGF
jgi:hypothetical protein